MTAPPLATSVWFLDPSASKAATGQRAPAAWASASLTLVSWPPSGITHGEMREHQRQTLGWEGDSLVACARGVTSGAWQSHRPGGGHRQATPGVSCWRGPWPVGQRTKEPWGGETLRGSAHGVGSGPRGWPHPDAEGEAFAWGVGGEPRGSARGRARGWAERAHGLWVSYGKPQLRTWGGACGTGDEGAGLGRPREVSEDRWRPDKCARGTLEDRSPRRRGRMRQESGDLKDVAKARGRGGRGQRSGRGSSTARAGHRGRGACVCH